MEYQKSHSQVTVNTYAIHILCIDDFPLNLCCIILMLQSTRDRNLTIIWKLILTFICKACPFCLFLQTSRHRYTLVVHSSTETCELGEKEEFLSYNLDLTISLHGEEAHNPLPVLWSFCHMVLNTTIPWSWIKPNIRHIYILSNMKNTISIDTWNLGSHSLLITSFEIWKGQGENYTCP